MRFDGAGEKTDQMKATGGTGEMQVNFDRRKNKDDRSEDHGGACTLYSLKKTKICSVPDSRASARCHCSTVSISDQVHC